MNELKQKLGGLGLLTTTMHFGGHFKYQFYYDATIHTEDDDKIAIETTIGDGDSYSIYKFEAPVSISLESLLEDVTSIDVRKITKTKENTNKTEIILQWSNF